MARKKSSRPSAPWRIHFFRRHPTADPLCAVPALEFLEGLPVAVAAEIHAVLDAVASAPPPAFSGGGKWEAMHGDMAGFYEIRVQGDARNHRMFCILDRNADDLGGPSIVCIGGLSKDRRSAADPREYKKVRRYGDEFRRHRTVLE